MMKKKDWIDEVAQRAGVDQRTARSVLDAFVDTTAIRLQADRSVQLYGLGKLFVKTRAARTARDFTTGEKMAVPAHDIVSFAPSASTAALVDNRK